MVTGEAKVLAIVSTENERERGLYYMVELMVFGSGASWCMIKVWT